MKQMVKSQTEGIPWWYGVDTPEYCYQVPSLLDNMSIYIYMRKQYCSFKIYEMTFYNGASTFLRPRCFSVLKNDMASLQEFW